VAVGLPAILSWNASNGATSYRLQVSSNPGFTGIVFDSNSLPNPINSTSYAVSSAYLTAGLTYYWRVSAANNAGSNGYSAFRTFQP
jgi:trimeric autotransporter adhesin